MTPQEHWKKARSQARELFGFVPFRLVETSEPHREVLQVYLLGDSVLVATLYFNPQESFITCEYLTRGQIFVEQFKIIDDKNEQAQMGTDLFSRLEKIFCEHEPR
jgi:hypothetical protein